MRILLIRLRLIGDVVFTTPLIRALRRAYPDAWIAYLVEREAAPVVEHNPHVDEVVIAPRTRGARRIADDLALARRLRRERFDLVLDLHGGPRSAWLTWASGAGERVGYDIKGRRWMYTRVVHRPREQGFSVQRDDDGAWRVHGQAAERVVAMADLTNSEAIAYVQERFRRMGVERALARAGAREGDTVRIGPIELEYVESFS